MSTAIRVEHLSKEYRLGSINHGMLYKDMQSWLARRLGRPDPHAPLGADRFADQADRFWALKDLNFDIQQGDRVGIIGRNGAGKSTLLKILSRITAPTEGVAKIKGRVASLLEVGTGFHPELSGRENIYLNGAILGMKKKEIDRKIDEIIDFAEVTKFIDTPVKRYSSGMYVRLAFAVAAHLDSDILISDEVLTVGDAAFQKKAMGKMSDLSVNSGRTVLFVSHNMAAVRTLCNRGIVLRGGALAFGGDIGDAASYYAADGNNTAVGDDLREVPRVARNCSMEARIVDFSFRNSSSPEDVINADLPSEARITFEVLSDGISVGAEFSICDEYQKIALLHSYNRNGLVPVFPRGVHSLTCILGPLPLVSGRYAITLGLSRPGTPIDYLENARWIEIVLPHRKGMLDEYNKSSGNGCVYIEHSWK